MDIYILFRQRNAIKRRQIREHRKLLLELRLRRSPFDLPDTRFIQLLRSVEDGEKDESEDEPLTGDRIWDVKEILEKGNSEEIISDYKKSETDVDKHSNRNEPVNSIQRESTSLYKSLSVHHLPGKDIQPAKLDSAKSNQRKENDDKLGSFISSANSIKDVLRKSFSFNDLNSIYEKGKKEGHFFRRSQETNQDSMPNITVQPPSTPDLSENNVEFSKGRKCRSAGSGKKTNKNSSSECTKVPFSFLGINDCSIIEKARSVAPIHPVARPNLAAKLRLEVSKKKVKELQNNRTFQNHTPQIDWEVRKTPAWKSLSHNESHKEILALRLATRKAEQDYQKREYEMHMEIMRQRVKSAPLLLEGLTFLGPHVGKLSHTCYNDNLKHHNFRKKTNTIKRKGTYKIPPNIYLSNKSYSRISNHSTNLNESDELSSIDRAYL